MKGMKFDSLQEQNEHLRNWNRTVARLRIHGSTKQQVWQRFVELERDCLQPLPESAFEIFDVGFRKVHPDGYIELKKAFYSAPHQYMGRQVEVHYNEHILRIYCDHQLIAVHRRSERIGRFNTHQEHLPQHKNLKQEGFQRFLLTKASHIGQSARNWAAEAVQQRGPLAFRVIQGMLRLTREYPKEQVEWVCRTCLDRNIFKLRVLKRLLTQQKQDHHNDTLMQEHDLIRPLSDYTLTTQEESS